jgi:hypothetical protein
MNLKCLQTYIPWSYGLMVLWSHGIMVLNCLSKFVLRLVHQMERLIRPFGIKLLNVREKRVQVETGSFGKKLGFR